MLSFCKNLTAKIYPIYKGLLRSEGFKYFIGNKGTKKS